MAYSLIGMVWIVHSFLMLLVFMQHAPSAFERTKLSRRALSIVLYKCVRAAKNCLCCGRKEKDDEDNVTSEVSWFGIDKLQSRNKLRRLSTDGAQTVLLLPSTLLRSSVRATSHAVLAELHHSRSQTAQLLCVQEESLS